MKQASTHDIGRQSFAKGSLLNLFGAGVNGMSTFALALVLTRQVDESEVGAFMVGVAALTITSQAAQLGANTGLVRFIPILRQRQQPENTHSLIKHAFAAVFMSGTILAGVLYVMSPFIANLLAQGGGNTSSAEMVQGMALLVPFVTLFLVATQATQGFGTMTPSLLIDKIGRPLVQVVMVGVLATYGYGLLIFGYGIVYPIGIVLLGLIIIRMSGSPTSVRQAKTQGAMEATPKMGIHWKFWKFSLPRSLSTTFQVGIMWADTILIGFMLTAAEAGIYAVATRFLAVGGLVVAAVLQAMNPRLSHHLSLGETPRAEALYQRGTSWVIAAVWPLYLVVCIFAPWLLQIFGPEYQGGANALRIVAIAMMISGAFGAVDSVLLMGGRSWLSATNWGIGLTINIGLNLILIPKIGIEGAAWAWLASILARNVLPAIQIARIYGMQPTTPRYWRIMAAALLIVGVPSLLAAVVLGVGPQAFAIVTVPGCLLYLLVLIAFMRKDRNRGSGIPESKREDGRGAELVDRLGEGS